MHDLITRITDKTGLDAATAEKACGIMLSLVRSQGDRNKVAQLFEALPGASDLADRHGSDGAKGGGLLGMLGGGLMGGPLAAVTKLQSAGLSMDQIKTLGKETLGYARERAGEDLVRDVANSIPGISSYL